MTTPAPLLLVHVTPASYRALPARLHPDDLASMSITSSVTVDLVREALTTMVEEAAMRCSHLDGRELIKTIFALCTDLSGEVGGALAKAAEAERDELYGEVSTRGPFYRRRVP